MVLQRACLGSSWSSPSAPASGAASCSMEGCCPTPGWDSCHSRAGRRSSSSARSRESGEGLTWAQWAADVSDYLDEIDLLLRPDLFVLGGGLVNGYREFGHLIRSTCPLVPATLGDRAGDPGRCHHGAGGAGDLGRGRCEPVRPPPPSGSFRNRGPTSRPRRAAGGGGCVR